jgi:hypothetical protein
MNLFLSLILVTVAALAYVAFTIQQQTSQGFNQRLGVWQSRVDELQAENQQLKDTISLETTKEANWSSQLKNAQQEIAERSSPMPGAVDSSDSNPAAHPTTSALNDLGTIVTITGKTFQNCQLLKVEPDGITFSHADGITKVLFPYLPPAMQKRFGYDPAKTAELEAAELRYQDQMRQAAAAASANSGTPQPATQ